MVWTESRQDDKHAQNAGVYRENFSKLDKDQCTLQVTFMDCAFSIARRKTRDVHKSKLKTINLF